MIVLALGLVACSTNQTNGSGSEVIHIEDGANETAIAQTAAAQASATPEPGSGIEPPPEGTPYVMPTDPPDLEPDTAITRVGNEEITLGDFRKRVRFERWVPLFRLAYRVDKYGPERVLDLTDPENIMTASLFVTLADSYSFGRQVHRLMVIDEIAFQEAQRRDLELDQNQFNARLAEFLGMTVGEGGALPPEFDALYPEFIASMERYTGMTENEFRRLVRARTLYAQLKFIIGHEPGAVPSPEGRVGIEVQDILVDSMAVAESVIDRLLKGESLRDIALSLGLNPTAEDTTRVLRRSDPNVSADVSEAVYAASPGEIVGPLLTSQGWYVALVGNEVFDVLSPQDVEAVREQYFLDWVEAQMDDAEYVEDYDNWFDYIPQEPLPRDVSPWLQEEYMTIPEYIEDPFTGDPLALPGLENEADATEAASE
jgi:hypothetical protein